MKWTDFESKNPAQYPELKELCEEVYHLRLSKGGFTSEFCHHCYTLHGWYSFPCKAMETLKEQRADETPNPKNPQN